MDRITAEADWISCWFQWTLQLQNPLTFSSQSKQLQHPIQFELAGHSEQNQHIKNTQRINDGCLCYLVQSKLAVHSEQNQHKKTPSELTVGFSVVLLFFFTVIQRMVLFTYPECIQNVKAQREYSNNQ